jgi:hypothetical protein
MISGNASECRMARLALSPNRWRNMPTSVVASKRTSAISARDTQGICKLLNNLIVAALVKDERNALAHKSVDDLSQLTLLKAGSRQQHRTASC